MVQRTIRKRVKVPLFGQPAGKVAKIEDGATMGATIGQDLYLPDGQVATIAALRELLASGTAAASSSIPLARTLWSLIQEIPANVLEVAALATSGLVVRQAAGDWITRSIEVASTARLTIANGDGDAGAPTLDLADVDALSVWGRASNTSGKPAPILAAANDRVFSRVGDALAFTQLTAGMFPSALTLATEFTLTGRVILQNADFVLWNTSAGADAKRWAFRVGATGTIEFFTQNDAGSGIENLFSATRSGADIVTAAFASGVAAASTTIAGVAVSDFARRSQPNTFTQPQTISAGNTNSLTIENAGDGVTGVFGTGSGTVYLGTVTNHALTFYTNNVYRGEFSANGLLYVVGGALQLGTPGGAISATLTLYDGDAGTNQKGFEFGTGGGTSGHYIGTRLDNGAFGEAAMRLTVNTSGEITQTELLGDVVLLSTPSFVVDGLGTFRRNGSVVILQDTSGSASDMTAFLSFQDAGSNERGWYGFGHGTTQMSMLNSVGPIVVVATGILTLSASTRRDLTGSSETRLQSDSAFLSFYDTANTTRRGYLFAATGGNIELVSEEAARFIRLTTNAGGILFSTDGASNNAMTIDSAGQVAVLDVTGSLLFNVQCDDSGPWAMGITRSDAGTASRVFLHDPGAGYGWVFEHLPYFYDSGSYSRLVTTATAATITTGNFTGTLTGMSAGTTGTVQYRIVGNLCTLFVNSAITGTSNAATMTMTGLPAAVVPSNVRGMPCWILNAGTVVGLGSAEVTTSNTIVFAAAADDIGAAGDRISLNPATHFESTGTKGLPAGWTITYPLS